MIFTFLLPLRGDIISRSNSMSQQVKDQNHKTLNKLYLCFFCVITDRLSKLQVPSQKIYAHSSRETKISKILKIRLLVLSSMNTKIYLTIGNLILKPLYTNILKGWTKITNICGNRYTEKSGENIFEGPWLIII